MSDIVGGKAIALVQRGGIEEKPHARTFVVPGRGYTVTFGTKPTGSVPRYECTCPASGRCYHGEAAILVMAKEREEHGRGRQLVPREVADELATAIDRVHHEYDNGAWDWPVIESIADTRKARARYREAVDG